MLKEEVQVISSDNNKVVVKFNRKQSCSCCKNAHICGINSDTNLTLDNPGLDLKFGDTVEVLGSEKKSILASFLVFAIPAVLFVGSLIIFKARGEFMSFSLAILLLIVYYLVVKVFIKKRGEQFKLKIIRKL